jgi:hypothetical protein
MPTLFDYTLVVERLVKDEANKLTAADRDEAVQQAVQEHTRTKPWQRATSMLGSGSAVLGLPTGWQVDASILEQIEYPVGTIPPTYLAQDEWRITAAPTAPLGLHLLLFSASPGTAERLNLFWTAPHVVSEATSTIAVGHYRAVAALAASYACLQLAGFYSQAGDPTISLDSQDPRTKAQEYRALAREYRGRYQTFFGLGSEGKAADVQAASVSWDIDRNTGYRQDFFVHQKRYR